jgi:hypothetical protein
MSKLLLVGCTEPAIFPPESSQSGTISERHGDCPHLGHSAGRLPRYPPFARSPGSPTQMQAARTKGRARLNTPSGLLPSVH